MAVLVQTDIANQLMRQLRILDPSVSVDIGTLNARSSIP
jgi:hypothetical protein